MQRWRCALELNSAREVVAGSFHDLGEAIGRGADLRVGTAFRHNEHIDVRSPCDEWIEEVAEFRTTYRLADRWCAGIMTLRQPIELPTGFGPRPSMSFFLYNQDGAQAIARPYLDGQSFGGVRGPAPIEAPADMPKYHAFDHWDAGTNAPSHNFVYDFERYRWFVHDVWTEVLSHDEQGRVVSGSIDKLFEAFVAGCELKLAVRGICDDLATAEEPAVQHELFVHGGAGYHYVDRKLFMTGTHPTVRVRPTIPLRYASGNWDFGWLMARTDGHVVHRRCDPWTLAFEDRAMRCAIRWFVR